MAETHTQDHDTHGSHQTANSKAREATRRASDTIEANPLGILVGGLAVGALAGTLIPRSAKEKQLLAPVGRTLADRTKAAVSAAKEAGYGELDQRGLTKDAARDQVKSLFQNIVQAAQTAGTAAAKSATSKG